MTYADELRILKTHYLENQAVIIEKRDYYPLSASERIDTSNSY